MRLRSLIVAAAAVTVAAPAWAAGMKTVVDVSTDKANDLRGLTFVAGGKIVASGHVGMTVEDQKTVVARFLPDGKLDTTFGTGGVTTVDIAPGRGEQSLNVTSMANGDLVVAVNAVDADGGTSVYLLRFDANGARKVGPAWGDADGKVEVTFGWANKDNALFTGTARPADQHWDLQVDRSGGGERLVVFGSGPAAQGSGRTDADRYIVRLNGANGSPDPTFNGGKPYAYNAGGVIGDNARRSIVEADGAIVAAGYVGLGTNHVALVRLTPAGVPDDKFGNFVFPADTGKEQGVVAKPGVAVFNPFKADGGFAETYGVARLSDGSYVTTGYGQATTLNGASTMGYKTSVQPDLVTFKMKGNALDMTWGNKGAMAVQSETLGKTSQEERGRAIVALPDDRTVQVGYFGGVAAAYVFTKDGQLDKTVDGDGIIEFPNATIPSQFFNIVASPDNKRLAMATNAHAAGARLVVVEVE